MRRTVTLTVISIGVFAGTIAAGPVAAVESGDRAIIRQALKTSWADESKQSRKAICYGWNTNDLHRSVFRSITGPILKEDLFPRRLVKVEVKRFLNKKC